MRISVFALIIFIMPAIASAQVKTESTIVGGGLQVVGRDFSAFSGSAVRAGH